jgi:hypothetical protein
MLIVGQVIFKNVVHTEKVGLGEALNEFSFQCPLKPS